MRPTHPRAVWAFVAVVLCLGASFGACTSYKRENGENCLKDDDCISGLCISTYCGNPSTPLPGPYPASDGASSTQPTGNQDSGNTTPSTDSGGSAADSSSGGDATADGPPAPTDSGHALVESGPDAMLDAAADAADGAFDANMELDADDASDGTLVDAPSDSAPDAPDALRLLPTGRDTRLA